MKIKEGLPITTSEGVLFVSLSPVGPLFVLGVALVYLLRMPLIAWLRHRLVGALLRVTPVAGPPAILLASIAPLLVVSSAEAVTPEEEQAIVAASVATLQQAKNLLSEQRYTEAEALLAALSTALHDKLGGQHQLTVTTDQLLKMTRKLVSASAHAQPTERDPKKTYVGADQMATAKQGQAEAQAALQLLKDKKYSEGIAKLDAAMDKLEFALGPDHEFVVTNRKLLLEFYDNVFKDPQKAKAVRDREARARKEYKPTEPPDPKAVEGRQQLMQAMTAFASQDFQNALRLFELSLPKLEKDLEKNLETKVNAYTILSRLYAYTLQYDRAETTLKKLITDIEQAEGKDSPLLDFPLEAMIALMLSSSGPQGALPYTQRRVALLEKQARGSEKHLAAVMERANAYLYTGSTIKALQDFETAQALMQKLPVNLVRTVKLIHSVRYASLLRGDQKSAAELEQQACDLGKKATDPLIKMLTTDDCVGAARRSGNWSEAERILASKVEALAGRDGALASPSLQAAVHELALLKHGNGKLNESRALLRRSLDFQEKRMRTELGGGSNAQKRNKFGDYRSSLYDALDLGRAGGATGPWVELSLETLLRRKGRVLDVEADAARAARLIDGPEERALLSRQRELRALITGLVLKGESSQKGVSEFAETLARLESENASITKQLSEKSRAYRTIYAPVTVDAVRSELPQDTALLEYAFYVPHDPRSGAPTGVNVVAFLLTRDGQPQRFDLGDAAPILAGTEKLRKTIISKGQVAEPAKNLHDLVLSAVRTKVGNKIKRLLISPDDALNLIPFAALQSDSGRYLVQDYEVGYLTSGRDLLRLKAFRKAQSAPLVVGNPDFDAGVNSSSVIRSGDLSDVKFTPLPGTAEEVKAVAASLDDARLLTGSQATKAAVRDVQAPTILHIATHGFFLEIDNTPSEGTRGFKITQEKASPQTSAKSRVENPLIRSGLALSGANDPSSASGVLAALEAATMNLDGTRLVVLSACETAVGSTDPGEGVYGLRRALLVAGAESQLMSLWKVDDAATRDLMIDIYGRLKEGKARGASIRQAQLSMLKSKNHSHPYYWAAFIPSGNYGPMSFEVAAQASGQESQGSERPSSGSSGWGSSWVMTAGGSKLLFGARGRHLGNLLNQEDRFGTTLVMTAEMPLFTDSEPDGETGFAVHDAFLLELELGARTSKPNTFDDGEDESALAGGYFAGYELAFGLRTEAFGLLAGGRPQLRGYAVGSATHAGLMLPAVGIVEFRFDDVLVAAKGWYGTPLVDQEVAGLDVDFVFDESIIVRAGAEQTKLVTKVGGATSDMRLDTGRQVGTAFTISVGGYTE